jgi:protein CpxP
MKQIVMMMMAVAITVTGFGQHRHERGSAHGQRGTEMKEALGLDSAQYATIKGINRKYHDQARSLKQDTSQSLELRQKGFKSLRDAREQEINKVLTPDQNKKLDGLKQARKDKREEATKARKGRRDDQVKSKLSISDDQLGKMKKAREESFGQAQKDYEKKLKSILSDEQFKKWKEMQGDGSKRKR